MNAMSQGNMRDPVSDADAETRTSSNEVKSQEEIDQAVCTPGETACFNGTLHKCNSSGRWFATGQSC